MWLCWYGRFIHIGLLLCLSADWQNSSKNLFPISMLLGRRIEREIERATYKMGGDDRWEEWRHEHAVDDSAAIETSDSLGEIGIKMDGVAVAAHLRVPRHVWLGEAPRLPQYVADFEQPSRFWGGRGRGWRTERDGERRRRATEDSLEKSNSHRHRHRRERNESARRLTKEKTRRDEGARR